ncbi:MAG: dihydrodipicolinate synthase family protein [Alphaproteobacteria bacterium]
MDNPADPLRAAAHRDDPIVAGLSGIVPSLNTPFTADDRVDIESVHRQVDHVIDRGCAGMLVLAVAGEGASLAADEFQSVVEAVVTHCRGRRPVIVSVTAPAIGESVRRAELVARLGAGGVLFQPAAGLRGDRLERALLALSDAGPGLLMLQDLDWHGPGLELDDILRLFDRVPAFRALKIETVPAGPKYSAVLDLTAGRLHVSGGWAVTQMLDALDRGVHAFMPTGLEATYVAIHRLHRAGRVEEARTLFEAALPVLAFANQHIDVSIRFFKELRRADGIFTTNRCRPPVPELDAIQWREARRLVAVARALEARVREDPPAVR